MTWHGTTQQDGPRMTRNRDRLDAVPRFVTQQSRLCAARKRRLLPTMPPPIPVGTCLAVLHTNIAQRHAPKRFSRHLTSSTHPPTPGKIDTLLNSRSDPYLDFRHALTACCMPSTSGCGQLRSSSTNACISHLTLAPPSCRPRRM